MIEAVLDLDSSSVEQIMRPRVEVVALSTDDSLLALLEAPPNPNRIKSAFMI